MQQQFDGRVALITGSSSGIGRACAQAMGALGAKIVVADLDSSGGHDTVKHITERGGEAIFVHTDVTNAESVDHLVSETLDTFGRLDYAVNNAGIGATGMIHEFPEELWDRVLAVNLRGVFLCMKYELRHMIVARAGVIVNIASAAGIVAMQESGPYTASKHGVVGLTKVAALQYAEMGIRVNAICPAYIRTSMTGVAGGFDTSVEERLGPLHPVGRMGSPDEVAGMVQYLCSDQAAFVTGSALLIDGGYTAR